MMIRCVVCDSKFYRRVLKWKSNISLYECNDCSVQFWYPVKHPGEKYYEESLISLFLSISPVKKWEHKQFLRDNIFYDNHQKKILDIGCGAGQLLDGASKLGYVPYGIDINKKMVEIAREKFGLRNVFCTTLEKFIRSNSGEFDVITFFEVLEHLDNPKEFINQVKKLARKGSYIALSVPNRKRSLDTIGEGDFPPNHLTRWDILSMNKFLTANGIKVEKIVLKPLRYDDIAGWLGQKIKFGLITRKFNKIQRAESINTQIQQITRLFKIKKLIFDIVGFNFQVLSSPLRLKGSNMYFRGVVED